MEAESRSRRWSIWVSPNEDRIVRRAIAHKRISLNEYVVRNAVSAAIAELPDRRKFELSADQWQSLQGALESPPDLNPRLVALLTHPSVLEAD